MRKGRLLFIILMSIVDAINQYVLFFTLHMLLESVLNKVGKVLLAFIVDRNSYIRIKNEMSLSMSIHHWEQISILFLLYFGLVSISSMYLDMPRSNKGNAEVYFFYKKSYISLFMLLFWMGSYLYIIVLNHSIYKSNPYEAPVGIFIAFITPYLYYKVVNVIVRC